MIPYSVDTVFFTGVVEDRKDPLFLGRVRVRIHGFHSKWKKDVQEANTLPGSNNVAIDELPWAMPMQPITSAAMTGIGSAPVGPVEGTWVFGIFLDGNDRQQPLIIGTMGGIELKKEQEGGAKTPGISKTDGDNVPVVQDPNSPVTSTPYDAPTPEKIQTKTGGVVGPLSAEQYQAYKDALGRRESGSNYGIVNTLGYLGKYQMGAGALYDLGYVKSTKLSALSDPNNWTGKDGINSRSDFLNSPSVQENAMDRYTQSNYSSLVRLGVVDGNTSPEDTAGYMAAAHLLGPGGARNLKNGNNGKDGYGTDGASYFKLGSKAVSGVGGSTSDATNTGDVPPPKPAGVVGLENQKPNFPATPSQPTNQPSSFDDAEGFKDPNKVYPKFDDGIDKRPDTNYLAYNDHIDKTHVKTKEDNRTLGVEIANEVEKNWDQPLSPYNANYPYNHVTETESGHVFEFDDTAQNERINLWHKTGTFTEIDKNGTRVTHIVGDEYYIMERHGNVYVGGKCNITVCGSARLYVKKDAEVQVDGDVNLNGFNDLKANISGKMDISVRESMHVRAKSVHFETDGETNGEAFTIKAKADDGAIRIQGAQEFNVHTEKDAKIYTNQKMSLKSDEILALDGLQIFENSDIADKPFDVRKNLPGQEDIFIPPERKSPEEPDFPELQTPHRSDKPAFFYDEPGYPPDEVDAFIQGQISTGNVTREELEKAQNIKTTIDTTLPPDPAPQATVAPLPTNYIDVQNFSPALQLSNNFNLAQLTTAAAVTPYAVVPQRGLSAGQIVANLQVLTTTALDPIKSKYPGMIISSGFRLATTSIKISQHELGQAVDIQFPGYSINQYYDIATWIRDNVPNFNQLILEYKTTGTQSPWIHLSVNYAGNLKQCLTMMNHKLVGGSLNLIGG